jgi:hypothetical protein
MFKVFSLLVCHVLAWWGNSGASREKGVLVLTDANFEEEVEKYNGLLVMFYVPWW